MGGNRDRGQAGVDACAVPISVGGIIIMYFTGYLPCELPRKGGGRVQPSGGKGGCAQLKRSRGRYSRTGRWGSRRASPGEGCGIRHEGDRLMSLFFYPRPEGVCRGGVGLGCDQLPSGPLGWCVMVIVKTTHTPS